jgi:hypothetical protein
MFCERAAPHKFISRVIKPQSKVTLSAVKRGLRSVRENPQLPRNFIGAQLRHISLTKTHLGESFVQDKWFHVLPGGTSRTLAALHSVNNKAAANFPAPLITRVCCERALGKYYFPICRESAEADMCTYSAELLPSINFSSLSSSENLTQGFTAQGALFATRYLEVLERRGATIDHVWDISPNWLCSSHNLFRSLSCNWSQLKVF